jgi:hypothetical protein
MARQGETQSAPDRNQPLRRVELKGSVRRGLEWGGSTEDSSAIPARNAKVSKDQRKTGKK